jgi:hypothetical protein
MDKEFRHFRVKILEFSASLVHVRWSYQSCDFSYRVLGTRPKMTATCIPMDSGSAS